MKKLFILSLITLISIFSSGCYTVLWNPSMEAPATQQYTEEESYYIDRFVPYYETPWWNYYSLPTISEENIKYRNNKTDRNDNNPLRNDDSINRGLINRGSDQNTPRPTINENGNTGSGSTKNTNSKPKDQNDTETQQRTNTNDSNSDSRNNSTGSPSRDTRNNDSQRNSGGRR